MECYGLSYALEELKKIKEIVENARKQGECEEKVKKMAKTMINDVSRKIMLSQRI